MSEPKKYRVRLKKARNFTLPGGRKLKFGKNLYLNEGDSKLAYFQRMSRIFEVKNINDIASGELPARIALRQRRARSTTLKKSNAEPKPEVVKPQSEEVSEDKKPEEEASEEEPRIMGAAVAYTKTQLNKMKRAELIEVAQDDFGLELAEGDLRTDIIAKILEADQD